MKLIDSKASYVECKPAKKQQWYNKFSVSPYRGNYSVIDNFLDIIGNKSISGLNHPMLLIYSAENDEWSNLQLKFFNQKLKKFDLYGSQIYLYVNDHYRFFDENLRRNKWLPVKETFNWVLDLDNTRFSSIEELRDYLKTRPAWCMPARIVQTSLTSFHLLYMGFRGPNEWTKEQRIKLACDMFGVEWNELITEKIILNCLERFGVDRNVLLRNPKFANIRVPGTINFKKTDNPLRNSDGSLFTCVDWVNQDGMACVDVPEPVVRKKTLSKKEYWVPFKEAVVELVAEIIKNKKLSKEIGLRICNNLTWLNQGKLQITQTTWATECGVDQPRMSRILKALVKANILKVTDEAYVKGKLSKKYGTGLVLKSRIEFLKQEYKNKKQKKSKSYYRNLVAQDYSPGITHDILLKDIRVMHRFGMSEEQIIEFCFRKQRFNGKGSIEYQQEIKSMVDNWFRKANIVPSPVVPKGLIDALEEYLESC